MGNNSIIILGAFALFLAFGYLSLLRSIARLYFPASSFKTAYLSAFKDSRVLANFGSSALFISIPATSLLLFWGWAPALLWLLIAHLLLDSILHLQVAAAERIHPHSTRLSGEAGTPSNALHRVLLNGFYILLTAIALSFLANLIDRQSGLVFALLCLFPAHKLLKQDQDSPSMTLMRVGLAMAVVLLGVMFAHQLGFAIYGEWQPLEFIPGARLDWLTLNNQTIIAACLLIACVEISRSTRFEHVFATFTGALLVIGSFFLAIKFILLQAPLDAPLNAPAASAAASTAPADLAAAAISLPSFTMMSLILFWTLGGLLLRLSHERDISNAQGDISSRFGRLQWESSLQLLFCLILLLSLAAAVGIGAWNSHYQASPFDQDLIKHFDLAISSISALLDPSEKTGTLMNTVLLVGLIFTGFSFLISIVHRLRTVSGSFTPRSATPKPSGPARATHRVQVVIVFLVSCYFIKHGIGVDIWAVVGCLAWTLFAHYTLNAAAAVQSLPKGAANTSFANYVILVVVLLGFVQSMAFVAYWYFDERIVAAALLQILILVGVSTWFSQLGNVLSGLKHAQQHSALDE